MKQYDDFVAMSFQLNGEDRTVRFEVDMTLLDLIRQVIGLKGMKAGCHNGDCGACTVLLDGKPVKACLMLALEAEGRAVTTIEGLKDTEVQRAFQAKLGFQCGFCTSGYIMNVYALLQTHPDADDETIERWLSSNLCRCTGYEGIERAVKQAQEAIRLNR